MFFDCPPPQPAPVTVRRERIKALIDGQPCEVLGDWLSLSDDFGVYHFTTHHGAFAFAFSHATLRTMYRKGLIK